MNITIDYTQSYLNLKLEEWSKNISTIVSRTAMFVCEQTLLNPFLRWVLFYKLLNQFKHNCSCNKIRTYVEFITFWGSFLIQNWLKYRSTVAQMAERVSMNSELPSSSPCLGSNETSFKKNKIASFRDDNTVAARSRVQCTKIIIQDCKLLYCYKVMQRFR